MKINEVVINGGEGRLEGRYYQSTNDNAPAVVLLHPDPIQGGTMHNKVVYNMFMTFAEKLNYSVLRFNFRGVGNSDGVYDNGLGEMLDAAAALDWLEEQNPNAKDYWVAGFSFGAWIGMQLMMRRPELRKFVAIAPPVVNRDFNFISPGLFKGLIVSGTEDEIAQLDLVENLFEKLQRQRGVEVDFVPIKGAGHFFENSMPQLIHVVSEFVQENK